MRRQDEPDRTNGERARLDHGRGSFEGRLTACSNSATVAGGAPRHTSSMTMGGATHATSSNPPLPSVMPTPATTLSDAATSTNAHQAPTRRRRETLFNMADSLLAETRVNSNEAASGAISAGDR